MTSSLIILSLVLLLSVAANFFMAWYSIRITRTAMHFSENLNDLLDILKDFAAHIKSVYELETFYGDETLHGLMQHGQTIVEQLEKFDEIIYLAEEPQEEDDVNEQEEEFEPDTNTNTDTDNDTDKTPDPNQEKIYSTQVRHQL
jgi:hypothetical protein